MAFGIFGWQKPVLKPPVAKVIIKSEDIFSSKKADEEKESKEKRAASSSEKSGRTESSNVQAKEGDYVEARPEGKDNPQSRKIYEEVGEELSNLKKQGTSRKDISRLDAFFQQVEDDLGQLKNKNQSKETQSGGKLSEDSKAPAGKFLAESGEETLRAKTVPPETKKSPDGEETGRTETRREKTEKADIDISQKFSENAGEKSRTKEQAGENVKTAVKKGETADQPASFSNLPKKTSSQPEKIFKPPVKTEEHESRETSLLKGDFKPAGEEAAGRDPGKTAGEKGASSGQNQPAEGHSSPMPQGHQMRIALQQKPVIIRESPQEKNKEAKGSKDGDPPEPSRKSGGLSLFEKLQSIPSKAGLKENRSLERHPESKNTAGDPKKDFTRKTAIIEKDNLSQAKDLPKGQAANLLLKEAADFLKKRTDESPEEKKTREEILTLIEGGKKGEEAPAEKPGKTGTESAPGQKTRMPADKSQIRDTDDEKPPVSERRSPLEAMKEAILKDRPEKTQLKSSPVAPESVEAPDNAPETFVTRDSLKNLSRAQLTATRLESQLGEMGKTEVRTAFFDELADRTSRTEGKQAFDILLDSVSKNPRRQDELFRGIGDITSTDKGLETFRTILGNLQDDQALSSKFTEGVSRYSRGVGTGENQLNRILSNVGKDPKTGGELAGVLFKGSLGEKGGNTAGSLMLQVSGSREASASMVEILTAGAKGPEGGVQLGRMLEAVGGESQSSSRFFKMLNSAGDPPGPELKNLLRAVSESPQASTGFLVAGAKASENAGGHRQVATLLESVAKDGETGKSLLGILSQGSSTERGLANTGRFLAAVRMEGEASSNLTEIVNRSLSEPDGRKSAVRFFDNMEKSSRVQQEFVHVVDSSERSASRSGSVQGILKKMQEVPEIRKGIVSTLSGGTNTPEGLKSFSLLLEKTAGEPGAEKAVIKSIIAESSTKSGIENAGRLMENIRTDSTLSARFLRGFAEHLDETKGMLENISGSQKASAGFLGVLSSGTLREEGRDPLNTLLKMAEKDEKLASAFVAVSARGSSGADGARQMGQLMKNISESPELSERFLNLPLTKPSGDSGKIPARAVFDGLSKDPDSSSSLIRLINSASATDKGQGAFNRLAEKIHQNPETASSFTGVLAAGASTGRGSRLTEEFLGKVNQNNESGNNFVKILSGAGETTGGAEKIRSLFSSASGSPGTSDGLVKVLETVRNGEVRNNAGSKTISAKPSEGGSLGRLVENISRDSSTAGSFISLISSATDTAHGQSMQSWILSSKSEVESDRAVGLLSSAMKSDKGRETVSRIMESASNNPRINSQVVTTLSRSLTAGRGASHTASIMENISKDPKTSSAFVKTMAVALLSSDSSGQARVLLENISYNKDTAPAMAGILAEASSTDKGRSSAVRLMDAASADPKTASSLVRALNSSQQKQGSVIPVGNFLRRSCVDEGVSRSFTGLLTASLKDESREAPMQLLKGISAKGDSSEAFVRLLGTGASSMEGLGRLENLQSGILKESGGGPLFVDIMAKAAVSEKGRESLELLASRSLKSEDAQTGLLSILSQGSDSSRRTVLENVYKIPERSGAFTSLITAGSINHEGAEASGRILGTIAQSPETSAGFVKSVLGAPQSKGDKSLGLLLGRFAASPATGGPLLDVQTGALKSPEGSKAFTELQNRLAGDPRGAAGQMNIEKAALQSPEGAKSYGGFMEKLAGDKPASVAYFTARAGALSTIEGLEAFTGKMTAVAGRPETASACFMAKTSALTDSPFGRDAVVSVIKHAGADRAAATALVDAQSSAAWTKEGQGVLTDYFKAVAGDDHALLSQFRMQNSADRDSLAGFSKAVVRDARLEASYNNAENSYRHLEARYSKFQGQLNEASQSSAGRKNLFRQLTSEISSPQTSADAGRIINVASKDPETWSRFSANLAVMSATSDKEGLFKGLMQAVTEKKPVMESFHRALAVSTSTGEGLNQFDMLLSKSSENTGNQAALINCINAGIGDDNGHFTSLMNNLGNSDDVSRKFLESTAQATSKRDGANGFVQALKDLSENAEPRESYFNVWANALETKEGRDAFVVLSDNTKSSSKIRNQFVETLTALNTTKEGREIFSRMVSGISEEPASAKAFLEQLNKMSLDNRAAPRLDAFIKEATASKECREALSGVIGDFLADKKGRLLIGGLTKNDQLMNALELDRSKPVPARTELINMRGRPVDTGDSGNMQSSRYMEKITSRPLVHLLSQQTGTTQTTAKETRMFSKFDGLEMTLPHISKVTAVQENSFRQDTGYRVNNLSYSGRIFEVKMQNRIQEMRLATVSSSSNKDKVEKIWIELNRRNPPMDPREIYQDARLRYQLLCRQCDNQKDFSQGLEGKICGTCNTDYDRLELMSSVITYKSKSGCFNSNADVISISPEAVRIFEVQDPLGDLFNVQTTSIMPTMKDMLQASRTGINRRSTW